jgi:uncharacterized protein (TIGR03083 family)
VDDDLRAGYLAHIEQESSRFIACLADADPAAPVPSCPEWTVDDLIWHLAEVQLFWGAIVRDRLDDPDAAEEGKPSRPEDHAALVALFGDATRQLLDALATTPPETEVWTWADDHTVAFVLRRQAHEALIHRMDAELVAGEVTELDAPLASDGVDEALTVMYGDVPAWSTFTVDDVGGWVEATDTGASWNVVFGRFSGTSPNTGKVYDDEIISVVDALDGPPAFVLSGRAGDLDAWLWSRGPVDALTVTGDRTAFDRLAAVVATGVQ